MLSTNVETKEQPHEIATNPPDGPTAFRESRGTPDAERDEPSRSSRQRRGRGLHGSYHLQPEPEANGSPESLVSEPVAGRTSEHGFDRAQQRRRQPLRRGVRSFELRARRAAQPGRRSRLELQQQPEPSGHRNHDPQDLTQRADLDLLPGSRRAGSGHRAGDLAARFCDRGQCAHRRWNLRYGATGFAVDPGQERQPGHEPHRPQATRWPVGPRGSRSWSDRQRVRVQRAEGR